jgi:hypothetical protein
MASLLEAQDSLVRPLEQLEQTLAARVPGREREWAQGNSSALSRIAVALRQRQTLTVEGLLVGVDVGRASLARQVSVLRRRQSDLLQRACRLQTSLQVTAQIFSQQRTLSAPSCIHAVPDFGALRASLESLRHMLERYRTEETKLILESINTDIGVGD